MSRSILKKKKKKTHPERRIPQKAQKKKVAGLKL